MGSTENVSWSKPFGDSAVGQAGGAVQNAVGQATQDVSWQKPFGNSALGQVGGYAQNATGFKGLQDAAGQVNLPDLGMHPTRSNPNENPSPLASSSSAPSASPMARGSRPVNSTSGEDSFRETYLKALKPSTAFTFNAQNPSTFGSQSSRGK